MVDKITNGGRMRNRAGDRLDNSNTPIPFSYLGNNKVYMTDQLKYSI
ncbi:hypothetical protein SAMN04487945_0902 [Halobacterium jilantaiense]|uniref:Uncharacterized protein n=1 Tax=Halobacterium jilantaiense TaxID=355548 RepID=A0A1I0NJ01_9EURY|nr:hypothetical protein SAMN04487945_0902 [Halobacterium jilantaiense]